MSESDNKSNSDAKLLENQIDEKMKNINKITDVSKLTEEKERNRQFSNLKSKNSWRKQSTRLIFKKINR